MKIVYCNTSHTVADNFSSIGFDLSNSNNNFTYYLRNIGSYVK